MSKSIKKEEIGERVKMLRALKGWMQKDLASKCHYNPQTISNIEIGYQLPGIALIEAIAKTFGLSIGDFMAKDFDFNLITREGK